jgi:serine/threonine-protein kinase
LVHEAFEVSDTVPVDSVIRTDPVAGTAVGVNTLITVYVSSGKTQFAMPDLAGMNEQTAKATLDQSKLTLGTIVQAHSSTVPQGQIIESDPVAGTMISAGTTVNLTVSDGLVDVPDVRNYSITEARSALNDSGLLVVLGTKDTCTGSPLGTTVVDQSILPGTTQAGGTITLFVTCAP